MPADSRVAGPQQGRPGEVRLAAAVAVVVAIVLYTTLPTRLFEGPRVVVPILEAVLLVPLLAANPLRMNRLNRQLRVLSLAQVAVMLLANAISFALLLHALLDGKDSQGGQLLLAALQVWGTNIIGFGLGFWELDRGGPVRRHRSVRAEVPTADFRFSQDEDADAVREVAAGSSDKADWRPRFVDYLYVSVTNSTAFSPTDTMPLSPRAKMLMAIESIQALLISILVIARGVSLLH